MPDLAPKPALVPPHPIACRSCGGGGGDRFHAGGGSAPCPACGRVPSAPLADAPMPDVIAAGLPAPAPVLGSTDEQRAEAVEAFWDESLESIVKLYERHPERRQPGGPDVTTER